jgi:hypothetical protein
MNIQYITDKKGHKSAVQLPIKEWEQIQKDLKELERLRIDIINIRGVKEASGEVVYAKKTKLSDKYAGKLPANIAEDLQKHIEKSRNEWDHNI